MQLSNAISNALSFINFVLQQRPKWLKTYRIKILEYTPKSITK